MTTHNTPKSDDAVVALCNSRKAGLQQFTKGVGSINVKGTPYKPAVLVTIYQKCIDTRTELAAIRAQEWETQAYWEKRIGNYLRGEIAAQHALPGHAVFVAVREQAVTGFIAGHRTTRHGCR